MPLAIAAVLALGSCRSLMAPSTPSQRDGVAVASNSHPHHDAARAVHMVRTASASLQYGLPEDDERRQVPVVTHIESVADARGLHIRIHLQPERPGDHPKYGPRTPGGWQFQMFFNVDQNPLTGYSGHGFEFLTRDSDADIEPGTLVLRRTEGGGGPGGWGDEIVRLPVHVAPRLVTFTVPLRAIDDDGMLNFGLDLYATVAGGHDGMTPVASFSRYYPGSSVHRGGPSSLSAMASTSHPPLAIPLSLSTTRASASVSRSQ
ncbi:MAG: hypothetical protein ABIS67_00600 [Candidatus Eisenbacteria bacterium]